MTEIWEASIKERQVLLLRRYWELLEQLKQYRAQVAFYAASMLLAVTGFVLSSEHIPSSRYQALGIAAVIVALSATAMWVIWIVRRRYILVNRQVAYLYERLGMVGEEFFPKATNDTDASILFYAAILVVFVIGTICAFGVGFAPVRPM